MSAINTADHATARALIKEEARYLDKLALAPVWKRLAAEASVLRAYVAHEQAQRGRDRAAEG